MTIQNKQAFTKLTYMGLTLMTLLSSSLQASQNAFDISDDEPVKGKSKQITINHDQDLEKESVGMSKKDRKKIQHTMKISAKKAAYDKALQWGLKEEEATDMASLIICRKRDTSETEENKQLNGLIRNNVRDAAKQAAHKVAYEAVEDEQEAQKLVDSLKLDRYKNRKSNPQGRKKIKLDDKTENQNVSNIMTIEDVLEQEKQEEGNQKKKIFSFRILHKLSPATSIAADVLKFGRTLL